MIESLSNYAMTIIFSSFLLNIIQMILPSGENKKYVLFVTSIIISIVIITPIINLLNKDVDVSKFILENKNTYIDLENKNFEKYYEEELINTYKNNIEKDIVTRLNEAGYTVYKIKCEYDEKTLEPKYLRLEIEAENGGIQPVRIEVSSNNINNDRFISVTEIQKVKSMLKEIYGIESVDINQ